MNKLGGNFMNDYYVNKAYNRWIHGPTLFDHYLDTERFYIFVKACVNYVKGILFVQRDIAWRELKTDFLKDQLSSDLAYIKEVDFKRYEKIMGEIVSKFEFLIAYEKVKIAFYRMTPYLENKLGWIWKN